MKPVEPITKEDFTRLSNEDGATGIVAFITVKLNELIQAHNELLAKYESHTHEYSHGWMGDTENFHQNRTTEPPTKQAEYTDDCSIC